MPIATVSTEGVRKELTTLPGAYVVIKPLSHGQALYRREMATNQAMDVDTKAGKKQSAKMIIDFVQRASTAYDFRTCIIDHNLEWMPPNAQEATKMDFKDESMLDKLDPRVGGEIEALIDSLNNFEERAQEEELGNS